MFSGFGCKEYCRLQEAGRAPLERVERTGEGVQLATQGSVKAEDRLPWERSFQLSADAVRLSRLLAVLGSQENWPTLGKQADSWLSQRFPTQEAARRDLQVAAAAAVRLQACCPGEGGSRSLKDEKQV